MNTTVIISESQKKLQIIFLFTVWLRACSDNGVNNSAGILSLVEFMVKELGWNRKKAGQQVLDFFQHEQNYTPDQLIELYQILQQ